MKHHLPKRILSLLLVLVMLAGFLPPVRANAVSWRETDVPVQLDMTDRLVSQQEDDDRPDSESVRVTIVLEEKSTIQAGFSTTDIALNSEAMAYNARLVRNQEAMASAISADALGGKKLDVVWNLTLVGNLISANVPYGKLDAIRAIPGVKAVVQERQYAPCVTERDGVSTNAYASSAMIGSPQLWAAGLTGAGSRIAIIDTGTDTDHQSFDNGAYLYALRQNAAAKGVSYDSYVASLDLLDLADIADVLPRLHASERYPGLTAEQLYGNEKQAFGFNYVDASLEIDHDDDGQGEHGSHVAGISTANRYIPTASGGYASAVDTVMTQGVAPDAQLITMKVFGRSSPFDSDYMAAIEDAILLGCDAVNLSLGTSSPGAPYTDVYNDLFEMLTETETVVVISAGNAYNWPMASTFGYLYNDDASFDTVGAPGSYGNAFTVASVDNSGTVGFRFSVADTSCFYYETVGYGNTPFAGLDKSLNLDGTEYSYVFLDGLGYADEYNGLNVTGKVVFVQRGTLNFAEKANNALSRGAAAVVVYNNTSGAFGMDLTGLNYAAPVVSISQEDADAIRAVSKGQGTHLTGKLTVYGKAGIGLSDSEYYTMSAFSSWGVPGDLSLKPEITAPGGDIYSVWGSNAVTGGGSDKYESMSGTSMAAPQVTGMVALLAQYFRENGAAETAGISPRHLAMSLLMSTAEPLYEENSSGNYYSLMNQGAGLARVDLAAAADSFVKVEGQEDYKVKAELGDDPDRTGIYEFRFELTNLTDSEQVYTLGADLFRQDVFEFQEGSDVWLLDTWTVPLSAEVSFYSAAMNAADRQGRDLNGDGICSAADADHLLEYVVGNVSRLSADGDISGDGQVNSYDAHLLLASLGGDTVTVPAGGAVTVDVRMALTDEAKAALDTETPNGTYVQAFVYARGVTDTEGNPGTTHSIPVLAFYGDWADPSMFDRGTLMDLVYMTSNTAPYLYQIIGPYGNSLAIDYGTGAEYYFGGNPIVDDATYLPERNAFNSLDASRLTEQGFSLIRGAGDARIQITDADTGEVYFERLLGELYPAYFVPSFGAWENTVQSARLNWRGTDASGDPLPEGTKIHVTLTALPYYYRQADGTYDFEQLGRGSSLTTPITIDNTAPKILNVDGAKASAGRLTVTAQDNEYVAAVALMNTQGNKLLTVETPNQTVRNKKVTVDLDLGGIMGQKFLVAVFDYANNVRTCEVTLDLPEIQREYFTAIDYTSMDYVGMDMTGKTTHLASTNLPVSPSAAEYVGGYTFIITADNSLCVANDEDLNNTRRICQLDPDRELLISGVNDMAYNYADGRLYVQYYSLRNNEALPYLATVDMHNGTLEEICQLPVDVNTMAIDSEGSFYSAAYGTSTLYTYTLDQVTGENPGMTRVGDMGYYTSTVLSSMAWDHNEDKLYWAYPNTLLKINPKTAEPTLLGYQNELLVGLYTRPARDEDMFDPVATVDAVTLNQNETRVMVGQAYTLEASVWPWNATDRSVTWSSSNTAVATVDANGCVTARSPGQCTITATSNLDKSKTASCTVSTFRPEKTLNAIIWDADSNVWMSEFNTATIPAYTKLHDSTLGQMLASATVGQDGNLYAASLDVESLKSDLYKLDPVTFQPTLIGPSTDGYVDLAPAPGQPGNSLMAVYGGNVLNVDADTGDYYYWYYMFQNDLVALAYVGTQEYKAPGWDTLVDWYFIIDRMGYVYLLGFLEQNGSYYYLEHDQLAPNGVYTILNLEMETPYFGSAYFDGEMLYFSAYRRSQDNVTLLAVDVAAGNKACYELGTFDSRVWPVAGLMELGVCENHIGVIVDNAAPETMSLPIPAEPQAQLTGIRKTEAQGTLNNAVAVPQSSTGVKDGLIYVDVTLPYAGTNADMTVSFDTAKLELVDVSGNTAAFAWKAQGGKIRLSLAEADTVSNQKNVARLTFRAVRGGLTEVSIVTGGLGSEGCGYDEIIPLKLNPFVDVPEGSFYYDPVLWAVDKGITTGATATTFNPNGQCQRAQVVTFLWRAAGSPDPTTTVNPFKDVKPTDFYYKAVLWAVEKGITNGLTATEFGPFALCNRAQVVTFLWRSQGSPASSAKVSFSDVKAGQFYTQAVSWAVEKGITNGMGDGTFGVSAICNRAQVVTFLYRTMVK